MKNKSRQGFVDNDIRNVVDLLNSSGYETTSSCSGRIVLLRVPSAGDKQHAEWLYKTHDEADAAQILETLDGLSGEKGTVYFLQEPPIIHVNCANRQRAEELLNLANRAGFKMSAVVSLRHFTVEIRSTERLETPLQCGSTSPEGSAKFVRMLVREANEKLARGKSKLERLENIHGKN